MNKENLRKVIYQRHGGLNPFEGGLGDETEMKNVQDLLKKRNGWFHQWIEGKTAALIENEEGEIEEIESKYIKFIDYRVGKGESHPQTSHRTVREPLDSYGSSR